MKFKAVLFSFSVLLSSLAFSQTYNYEDEDTTKTKFFIGVNLGGHFVNNKTAVFYSGSPSITQFGVESFLFGNQPQVRQVFIDYFGTTEYNIEEYPFEPRYQSAFELGLNLGFQITDGIAFFLDLNSISLRYEQFLTVGIDVPQNQNSLEPVRFEKLPLFGRESRFNFNLGTQLSYYNENGTNAYLSLFGNLNGVQLEENYFEVNSQRYDILHPVDGNFNQKPSGLGYGGGAGLGLKFEVTEDILADIYYNLYYNQINLAENLKPYGFHNSVGIRVLWH